MINNLDFDERRLSLKSLFVLPRYHQIKIVFNSIQTSIANIKKYQTSFSHERGLVLLCRIILIYLIEVFHNDVLRRSNP